MPYLPPDLPLVAPATIAQRAEAPPAEPAAARPAPPQKPIDITELAERVYQLMLRDALIAQEREV